MTLLLVSCLPASGKLHSYCLILYYVLYLWVCTYELGLEVCVSPHVSGAVEELVASHKVVLKEQQACTQELEEKEKLLKQEV